VHFVGGLGDQEQSAADQDDVAAGNPIPNTVNSGAVSRIIQVRVNSRTMRNTNASARPIWRARLACARQARDHDRNEDDVVDAENDLEHAERDQRRPGIGIKQQIDHSSSIGRPGPARQK
jgi:hypothetical protein